ncbi:MAG: hypothetical protein CMB52_05325 [Euryarchaeota archaeon]|nr:hypothetical protein [Euryarchaeota archaeon]|tara:strand:+ start:816 stop:1529 length:714 start_codon:yes stop_codon:yes gene_type:complete
MIITEQKLRRVIRTALLREAQFRGTGQFIEDLTPEQIEMWELGYEIGKRQRDARDAEEYLKVRDIGREGREQHRSKFGHAPGDEYNAGQGSGQHTYGPDDHVTNPDYSSDWIPSKKKKRKAKPEVYDEPEYGDEEELTIADVLPPAHYALAIGTDADVYEGDKFKVSPVQTDPEGTRYRWWKWGNLIDPIAFVLDPGDEDYRDFEDQNGNRYTPEQLFQALAGGKTSRFRFPKELYV